MARVIVGPPVKGDAFYDREQLVGEVLRCLEDGSVLLLAPRRFGKTSIMLRVKELLEGNGVTALYLDVEWINDISGFLTEVIYRLKEEGRIEATVLSKLKASLGKLIGSIEELSLSEFKVKLKNSLRESWEDKGREILNSMRDAKEIILMVDELPLMLLNMEKSSFDGKETLRLLQWLRFIRQSYPNIRFVFGGSIGIDDIIHRIGAEAVTTINDLARIRVGPFNDEVARNFVTELLRSEGIESDTLMGELLRVIDIPIPYFIQLLISAIKDILNEGGKVSSELVTNAYEKRLLGVEYRSYFDHYVCRLEIYYTAPEIKAVRKILTDVAVKGASSSKELYNIFVAVTKKDEVDAFNLLMSRLENDFYLSYDDRKDVYAFSTKILKDVWLRHYGVIYE